VEKIAQGPDCSLTEKQRQRVKRWIVGKDPRQYGFEFGLWTRRIVQSMIQEKMGVELCVTGEWYVFLSKTSLTGIIFEFPTGPV
jgi:transposase